MPRVALATAVAEASARDPVLKHLVRLGGPLRWPPRNEDGPFAVLARAIVFQQLAGRAAQAIYGRVRETVGGTLTAAAVSAVGDEQLRAAGLSANKVASLRDLAVKTTDGAVALDRLPRRDDEEVVAVLTAVRGIGRWTAEMYLMFELRRLDVWPVDDLGVRQGYGAAWALEPAPSATELEPLGDRFRPYRSVVARYCWEAVHQLRAGTDPALR
jgi:3-methyladenine DNA glycosylase/8-oxoguanine DNA glycosylase